MSINLYDITDTGLYFGDFPPSVLDITLPVITVTGGTTAMLQGGTYASPTVTASDDTDGDITADVVQTGTIDVNTAGTQTVYFDVQDAAGNDAVQASHTVVITALDSTPTQFNFVDQVDAALSTLITSAAITVLGINTDSAISVAGGEYSINGGAYTASAGTVSVDDAVTVRATSSGSNSTAVDVVLTIGGVSDTFTVTTLAYVPSDSVPDQFSFTAQTDVALSTNIESNTVTIQGIDIDSAISISGGGTYSVNGGAYTGASGTVSVNDTVQVQVMSSSSNSTPVATTLTIGGVQGTFSATTLAFVSADSTPDQFTFSDRSNIPLSSNAASAAITVLGIDTDSAITITGGSYSINGAAFTTSPGVVSVNDTVSVQVFSSGEFSTPTSATLTIGGVSDTFTATTLAYVATDDVPDQFTLGADVVSAALNTEVIRSFTITGVDVDTVFNATGSAQVSLTGFDGWSSSFIVDDDATGYMRLVASPNNSVTVGGGVEAGGISDSIAITTLSEFDNVYSSNIVVTENRNETNIVTNNASGIPIMGGLWDPDSVKWLDFQALPGKVVSSVVYSLPYGWTNLATRSDVTTVDSYGTTYDRVYSVQLRTDATRNLHKIRAVITYADGTVDPRSVRIRVGST